MRITRLKLANFKSVGADPQTIAFAPITLLFGANSAGKSTIIHALMYAYELLEKLSPDVDRVSFSDSINLGGFVSLLHNHDITREMMIEISCNLTEDAEGYLSAHFGADPERLEQESLVREFGLVSPVGEAGFANCTLAFHISWNHHLGEPIVNRLKVCLGDEPFCEIVTDSRGAQPRITNINWDSHFFQGNNEPRSFTKLPTALQAIHKGKAKNPLVAPIHLRPFKSRGALPDLHSGLRLRSMQSEKVATALFNRSNAGWRDQSKLDETSRQDVKKARDELHFLASTERLTGDFFSQAVCGSLQLLHAQLHKILAIGPLREVPERYFTAQISASRSRWYAGLAGWDYLARCPDDTLSEISESLTKLGIDYRIVRQNYELRPTDAARQINWLTTNMPPHLQQLETVTAVRLLSPAGTILTLKDVGLGLSQLVPILAAARFDPTAILCVEQPELHLHPKIQVELGDMFLASLRTDFEAQDPLSSDGGMGQYIIETHSEHLLLRLLRRIRESSEDIARGSIGPDDIAVYYFHGPEASTRATRLRVSSDGDFIDPWPDGFFCERDAELYL